MGDSDKLPDSGPGSYRFVEHRRYLDALLEALDVRQRVTFVIHDWGFGPRLRLGQPPPRGREGHRVHGGDSAAAGLGHWDKINMRPALQALRSEAGEEMVLRDNFFIEKILGLFARCGDRHLRRDRKWQVPSRNLSDTGHASNAHDL
jgi:haloalkane dehalogenase